MPHFVMDCSESVLKSYDEEFIIEQIHLVANATGLFDENDIKVRLNSFQKYSVGNQREDFIHVFAAGCCVFYFLEGKHRARESQDDQRGPNHR